jgi:hypothetical protein
MEVLGLGTIERSVDYRPVRRRRSRRAIPLVSIILVGIAVVVTTLLLL